MAKGVGKRGVMNALAIVACVVCAFAALVLAYFASWDTYLIGFPDSHFTDYDKASETPRRFLMWMQWGFVLLFLVLIGFGARARAVGLLVALIALVIVAIVQWIGIPWYFTDHLHLDNGIGG